VALVNGQGWVDEVQQWEAKRPLDDHTASVDDLAALAGEDAEVGEITGQLGHDITRLRLISAALDRGVTWATIGQMAMGGLSAKQAKYAARRLGRKVNTELGAARMPSRSSRPARHVR
jgi:hypothetical protein